MIYSSIAVLFWSILPIALKLSADFIDAYSLSWFRFFIALIVTFAIQKYFGQLRQFKQLNKKDWGKLFLAGIFLIGNYISFVACLKYLSPGTAQLNFQVAPFFLAFGGLLFFKEKLSFIQIICFITLAMGMLMFFHPHLNFDQNNIWIGVFTVQFSAFCWAGYALLQKSLLHKLSSNNIMLVLFALGAIVLAPFTQFHSFNMMDSFDWYIAIFCAVNTLVAYGCFGQAMRYWKTASISGMVALTPVFSFIITELVVDLGWWSNIIKGNDLDMLSISGIGVIVLSVMSMQLLPKYYGKLRLQQI